MFLRQVQELENLNRGAFRLLKLLVDRPHALHRLIGFEERDHKGEEHAQGHLLQSNFVAGVKEKQGNDQRLQQVHKRRAGHISADPTHGLSKQPLGGGAKLSNLKLLHAERFNHAVSADCFLQYLAQFAQPRLTILHGVANAPP